MAKKNTVSASEINQWIDNDEGLYCWWKSSRQSKRQFIRENWREIKACIDRVISGDKPAHYLRYGG